MKEAIWKRTVVCLTLCLCIGTATSALADYGDADELITGPFPATLPGGTTASPALTSLPSDTMLTDYVDIGNTAIDPYGFGDEAAHLNEPACALACYGTECGTGTGDSWGPICSWSDATLRAMWECGSNGTTSTTATINMDFGSLELNKFVAVRWNYGAADDSFDMDIAGNPTTYSITHSAGAGNTVVNVGVWDVGVLTGVHNITFTASAPPWGSQTTYGQAMLSEIAVWSTVDCTSNGDCDDSNICTDDTCSNGACVFTPVPGRSCGDTPGECENQDTCDAAGACIDNGYKDSSTVCRAAADVCDVAENCTGSSADCPTDDVRPDTYECRASAGVCDVAENCDGVNVDCPTDVFEPDTTECRADAGDCDVAENCTGSSADCPADAFEPNGTPCPDGVYCNGGEECDGNGTCMPGSYPCSVNEWCDESTPTCVAHGTGNFEPDGDVDLADFAKFQMCFDLVIVSGSDCEPANMIGTDGKIDLADYAEFSVAITGP